MARFSKLPKICTKRFFIYGIGIQHIWIDAIYVDQKKTQRAGRTSLAYDPQLPEKNPSRGVARSQYQKPNNKAFHFPDHVSESAEWLSGASWLDVQLLPTYLDMAWKLCTICLEALVLPCMGYIGSGRGKVSCYNILRQASKVFGMSPLRPQML